MDNKYVHVHVHAYAHAYAYAYVYVSNRRMRARAGTAPEVVGAAAAVHVAAVPAVAAKSCQNNPRIPRKSYENQ